jgi:tetratricopeptide (TPR) repeat protein
MAMMVLFAVAGAAMAQDTTGGTTQKATATAAAAPLNQEVASRIKALDEQAQASWKAKDWARVVGLYSQAIELDPKYAKGWRWRGAARSELGLHDLAIADRRKAVELEPEGSNNHNGLCWSLILESRPKEARPVCEKALEKDAQNLSATVNLGHTYLLQDDKEQAWRWYEQAIGLIQDEEDLNQGLLDDFSTFERKGWQVQLVHEARAHFEPRARRYLEARTKEQALVKEIQAADQAEDQARELVLRQQRLTLLSPWLAPDHPRRVVIENTIIDTRQQLGDKLAKAGQYSQAVPHYLAVLQAKEQPLAGKPAKDQGDLIVPLNDLASAYQLSGNYPSALPLFKRALVIAEEARGPEHPSTGTRLNNLAGLYESMGQYAQALLLYQRALAISEKANGPEHPSTGSSLNNLAYLYKSIGQYAQALPLYQRALAISEKAQGPEHPSTSTRLNNLADLYESMGQYAQALPLYQRALAISEKAQGPEHPSTGTRLNNLAGLYESMGQYARALPLYQRALAISEKAQGPEHPSTGTSLNNLAELYRALGQYAQALPLYQRALAISEKAQGPEHPSTSTRLNNLAALYESMGQYAQALALYQRALAISEKVNGPEHPSTGTRLNNLAGLYESMGQYAQALPLYQRALAISEKDNGPEHPSTGTRLNNLAGLYRAMGQYAQALPLYQRALAISEKTQGPNHPSTGTSLNNLAYLYKSLGQYAQALPLYQRALTISEKAEGPDHPNTGGRLNNLAVLYESMGQYAQALPLYARAQSISDRAGNPELSWNIQRNLMTLHGIRLEGAEAASLYQPPLAIWYGKQAVNTLQSVRGNMQGLDKDLQKGFLEKNQQTYQTLANLLIEAGRIPEAEQILAMLKERELGELVRASAADAQKTQADLVGVEKRASAQMAELTARGVREATELAALEKRIDNGETLSGAEESRRQALITAAEAWRAEFQRYTSSLSELFAQSARSQERKDAENNSTRLQAKVALDGAGAVGLHYVVTDERIAIIVATPQASFGRFSPIKRTELNRQINALRQAMVAKTDTRAPAQALWNALIAPVQADIEAAGAKTLVLSLTDTLRYLPFAALQNPQGRYLVEDMALSLWAQAADVTPTPSTQGWQVAALGLTQAREGFSALPAVRGELQGIVKTDQSPQGVLPGRISLDEQFNRAQLDQALRGQTNVVHIASHFDFRPGDESRSVLLLGQGESLSLGKLAVMNFGRVEQLTLSACDTATGGGTNENGAEVEGLAATVLRQQAKSVLATLWKVADDSTAKLMQDFYRQRAQDKPPSRAQALRAAQLALIRGQSVAQVNQETARGASRDDAPKGATAGAAPIDSNQPYAHPYYWAPFVLSGSWL